MATADLIYSVDHVTAYFGQNLSQSMAGSFQLLIISSDEHNMPVTTPTIFIQIDPFSDNGLPASSTASPLDPLTIPIIPGHTLINREQNFTRQFTIINPLPENQQERFWIEISPASQQDEVESLADVLMQVVAYQEQLYPTTSTATSGQPAKGSGTAALATTTTYQAPLKGHVPPPKSLAIVDPTGEVLGVVDQSSLTLLEQPIPPTTPSTTPVVIDTANQQVSLLDTAGNVAVKSAAYIGAGIVFGAAMLGAGIKAGSNFLINNTTPNSNPAQISTSAKSSADKMYYYSGKAVSISHGTVSKVSDYARSFGQKLSASVMPSSSNNKNESGQKDSSKWRLVRNIATAVDLIETSIEQSIQTLASDTKVATSNFVAHKYGNEARSLTDASLGVIENATLVYIDARGISRKAIIRAIGKGAVNYKLQDGRVVTMQPLENGSMVITDVKPPSSPGPATLSSSGLQISDSTTKKT